MSKEHKDHQAVHHEHSEHKAKEPKVNWGTVALVLVLVFCSALVATWAGFNVGSSQAPQSVVVDEVALSSTVEDYINSNLILDKTVQAKVIDVNDLGTGLVELKYEIYQDNAKVSDGVFYTNGNKLIIGQAFDLSTPLPKPDTTQANTTVETQAVKSDKPTVDLYVMSFCPYGNQAEDTFVPVYSLLKNKIDFNVHFIVSVSGDNVQSLHGNTEVVQDEREACVAKYYGNVAWLNFAALVNKDCGSSGACWESAATTTGIDVSKINACVASEGVALMKENAAASSAAGANGSPTLVINDVKSNAVYQYGNSESYKQAICSAFNNTPSECATALSANTVTGQGGSCGN